MKREIAVRLVRRGLDQIPSDGLRRLAVHMDAGKPVLLTGEIVAQNGKYG